VRLSAHGGGFPEGNRLRSNCFRQFLRGWVDKIYG